MKIIAAIPVLGRRPLLRITIERLYRVNKVYKVICSGDDVEDRLTAEAAGAEWVHHANEPLSNKWNSAIMAAEKYNPDAVLFVGSSDWICENWLPSLTPYLRKYDMIGKPDCYFAQIYQTGRVEFINWGGYHELSHRYNEPIGIGRLLSKRILKKLNWQPIERGLNKSMDYSSMLNVFGCGGSVVSVFDNDIYSLSIGTEMWENKHSFENEKVSPTAKSANYHELCAKFPEITKIFTNETV